MRRDREEGGAVEEGERERVREQRNSDQGSVLHTTVVTVATEIRLATTTSLDYICKTYRTIFI